MPSTPADTRLRLLLDLKPALDGYAGIPQESRLLFRGLRMMDGYEVEGLIQHGLKQLRSAVPAGRDLSASRRIDRLSRVIVSLHDSSYGRVVDKAVESVQRYYLVNLLRLRAMAGMPLTQGVFEPGLFDDFIWRTFFAKTLKPEDKALVTSARFHVLRPPRKVLHAVGLAGRDFSSTPRYLRLDTDGFDFFVAQTPFPARVSNGTRMVVRYHDSFPVLMPHTVIDKSFHQASHFYALQENVRAGAWFSCVSEATRAELLKIFPEAESRSSVIHNMVSNEYFEEDTPKATVQQIIQNRIAVVKDFTPKLKFKVKKDAAAADFDYLLMVSTIEPRKNHLMLTAAWERLRFTSMPKLKLVVVGSMGWDQGPILNAFRPWAERGELFYLSNVPSAELRSLYRHAAATICPSLAEGFDYTGIEAMKSGSVVVASDIPVHREIFGDASEYFNPYSVEEAAAVIQGVISDEGTPLRERLRAAGRAIAERYTPARILPQWDEFLRERRGK